MFKKLTGENGSPFFYAKSRTYLVAQRQDRYDQWLEATEHESRDLIRNRMKPGDLSSDVIFADVDSDYHSINFSSFDANNGIILFFKVSMVIESRIVAFTESGRPLSAEELRHLSSAAEESYCDGAKSLGALYVEMDINGERSIWYDDESCYEACKLSQEEIARILSMIDDLVEANELPNLEDLLHANPQTN